MTLWLFVEFDVAPGQVAKGGRADWVILDMPGFPPTLQTLARLKKGGVAAEPVSVYNITVIGRKQAAPL